MTREWGQTNWMTSLMKKLCCELWRCRSYLDHFVNVTFGSSEFGGILDFDENDEVKVMPHVMFRPRVLLKRHVLVVKCFTLQTCKNRQTYIMSGFVDEEVLQGTS